MPVDPIDAPAERRVWRPTLSVVTPTFNEADNVPLLVDEIHSVLGEVEHEIIVVDDDSPDRTWEVAERIAAHDRTVRVIRRFSDPGLSPAVMAGLGAARGQVLAVIDADLQHDPAALVRMTELVLDGTAEVAVGTRSGSDGSYGDWGPGRRLVSWVAALIARVFLRVPTSDPMSGFFAISKATFDAMAPKVNPTGFKILLEFIGRSEKPRVAEVGYTFRRRVHGATKLSPSVIRSYLLAVAELRLGRQIKGQFFLYSLVGASGVVVNLAVFAAAELADIPALDLGFDRPVRWSLLLGILVSIAWNFLLNNYFTFWERRFPPRRIPAGLAQFALVSALGVIVHVSVFQFLEQTTWLADAIGSQWARIVHDGAGFLVALISNYYLNVNYIWRRRATT